MNIHNQIEVRVLPPRASLDSMADYLHVLAERGHVDGEFPDQAHEHVSFYFQGVQRALNRRMLHWKDDDDHRVRAGIMVIMFAEDRQLTDEEARTILESFASCYSEICPSWSPNGTRELIRPLADFLGLLARSVLLDGHLPDVEDVEWERPKFGIQRPAHAM